MKFASHRGSWTEQQADAHLLMAFEEQPGPEAALSEPWRQSWQQAVALGAFKAHRGEVLPLFASSGAPLLLLGLGARIRCDLVQFRRALQVAGRQASSLGIEHLALSLPEGLAPEAIFAEAALLALARGAYRFDRYHGTESARLQRITLVGRGAPDAAALERCQVLAEATSWQRDLINLSPSEKYPEALVAEIKAKVAGLGLKVTELDHRALREMGAGGLIAVGSGSAHPPALLILEHGPDERAPLALVGKGITFDTGGISIKPTSGMDEMKSDMAGAATVAAAMWAMARLKTPVHVVGLLALAENMPSGSAFRPGDVVRQLSGKGAEILTTDAEGRLVLADAVVVAERAGAARVLTMATLTGACEVALGKVRAGLLASDADFGAQVKWAAERSGDRVWEMPTDPEYLEQIQSDFGDLKNSGGRLAGMITAGLFIRAQMQERTAWTHLDIAGVAYEAKASRDQAAGATGYGVELLYWLSSHIHDN